LSKHLSEYLVDVLWTYIQNIVKMYKGKSIAGNIHIVFCGIFHFMCYPIHFLLLHTCFNGSFIAWDILMIIIPFPGKSSFPDAAPTVTIAVTKPNYKVNHDLKNCILH
jgi:hypothetical protein